jgi:hypothetical protein
MSALGNGRREPQPIKINERDVMADLVTGAKRQMAEDLGDLLDPALAQDLTTPNLLLMMTVAESRMYAMASLGLDGED